MPTVIEKGPLGVDPTTPNVARMYDYLLGGKDYFAVDRDAAEALLLEFPAARAIAEANRMFLDYAVTRACEAGIRQFLDVGAGLPTTGNTHELAARHCPVSQVVYVDIDPVVCAHGRAILGGDPGVTILEHDAADVAGLLAAATDPAGRAPLDLTRPVAVVMAAVLHFVERPPADILADYLAALAPGSMVVVTHGTGEPEAIPALERARELYKKTNRPGMVRTRAELEAAFTGWDLDPPGLARVEHFTTDGIVPDIVQTCTEGEPMGYLAAVIARKP